MEYIFFCLSLWSNVRGLSEVMVKNFKIFSLELKANRKQIDEGCNIAIISKNQC